MDGPAKVVLLGGARTPFAEWIGGKRGDGKPGGRLASLDSTELGVRAARAALTNTSVDAACIDHVVMGNVVQSHDAAIYLARHVALGAGVPVASPAFTVNRLCGSGFQSVVSAAHAIADGARLVLAGGTENLSDAPLVLGNARGGYKLGPGRVEDWLLGGLTDRYCGLMMAQTSDNLARRLEITRSQQDEFALRSVSRAADAQAAGVFRDEIVPVVLDTPKGSVTIADDDHLYQGATLEGLSGLRPAFGKDGTVTSGNASGIVDGAACLVVASAAEAREREASVLANVVGWSIVGVDPAEMGLGPVPAIRSLLARHNLALRDIDRFEINEAFAGQYLAVEQELGLDRERTNVNGGSIAVGHPFAATGARLLLTLGLELRRTGLSLGVASACVGGGQGIAVLLENPNAG